MGSTEIFKAFIIQWCENGLSWSSEPMRFEKYYQQPLFFITFTMQLKYMKTLKEIPAINIAIKNTPVFAWVAFVDVLVFFYA